MSVIQHSTKFRSTSSQISIIVETGLINLRRIDRHSVENELIHRRVSLYREGEVVGGSERARAAGARERRHAS